jgi:hypothetical protein
VTDLLNGTHYRALVRLSTRANVTLAEPGETCEHVPAESLPMLLASGKIVPVTADADDASPPDEKEPC